MAGKVTLERLLRDEDDASGQSIREWKIESEPGFITIRLRHGDGFLIMREADIDVFVDDLALARKNAQALAEGADTR